MWIVEVASSNLALGNKFFYKKLNSPCLLIIYESFRTFKCYFAKLPTHVKVNVHDGR
jgi:hypothetical protein